MSFRWEDFGVCLGNLHAKKKKNGNFDAWKGLEFSHWSHFDLFLEGRYMLHRYPSWAAHGYGAGYLMSIFEQDLT